MRCGHAIKRQVPTGDHRERLMCSACGFIAYDNPKILVACIASWQDKVLWMKRATAPQRGCWAIPSGFMESGETPEQAAARELHEETGALIDPDGLSLYLIGSIPEISEVYLVYRGELAEPHYGPSEEATEVELYTQTDAPWDEFAYPDVAEFMQQFYLDHESRSYGVYAARYVEGIHTFRIVAR